MRRGFGEAGDTSWGAPGPQGGRSYWTASGSSELLVVTPDRWLSLTVEGGIQMRQGPRTALFVGEKNEPLSTFPPLFPGDTVLESWGGGRYLC